MLPSTGLQRVRHDLVTEQQSRIQGNEFYSFQGHSLEILFHKALKRRSKGKKNNNLSVITEDLIIIIISLGRKFCYKWHQRTTPSTVLSLQLL